MQQRKFEALGPDLHICPVKKATNDGAQRDSAGYARYTICHNSLYAYNGIGSDGIVFLPLMRVYGCILFPKPNVSRSLNAVPDMKTTFFNKVVFFCPGVWTNFHS